METILGRVLVAEDEETDWLLLRMAFQQARIPVELTWARDGVEVRDLSAEFERREPFDGAERLRTIMVLLDLKMPVMNGFEVLEWWREQPQLAGLPILVFTSSANPEDMETSKTFGAREYLVKPTGFENLVECVRELMQRYLLVCPEQQDGMH